MCTFFQRIYTDYVLGFRQYVIEKIKDIIQTIVEMILDWKERQERAKRRQKEKNNLSIMSS